MRWNNIEIKDLQFILELLPAGDRKDVVKELISLECLYLNELYPKYSCEEPEGK